MDLKNKRVVVIGDSHTDLYKFGEALESGLKAAGADVTVYAIGGTAASTWLGKKQPVCRNAAMGKPKRCHSLADLKGKTFDLAIIALGTNDAANVNRAATESGKSRDSLLAGVVAQIKEIGTKLAPNFVWVGPPRMGANNASKPALKWYTNDAMDALYRVALPAFGSSAIDSRPLMAASLGGDGVHLGGPAGVKWAEGVVGTLLGKSNVSITVTPVTKPAAQKPAPKASAEPETTDTTSTSTSTTGGSGFPVMPVALGLLLVGFFWLRTRKVRVAPAAPVTPAAV